MKIAVGTNNQGKIEAVKIALANYQNFANADIVGIKAESLVSSQPIGLDEIISGAKNRSKHAKEDSGADLGIGLESGIFLVPYTKSDYMDTTACAIYDGKDFHLGLSSCFEYPKQMIKKIIEKGKEISEIALELGFSEDKKFHHSQGMIGVLTKGIVTRINYSEQAVHMAIIHLTNREHY
ncbi:MAG: protein of unknown function DUF84 [uncultured bacterium]|nr:MAG: protein of unknown function DUF84 [uncultured bacterium]HBD05292.1 inosine/xanthosine triphosphatase [Candidatus Uhrbacteria bacterium]